MAIPKIIKSNCKKDFPKVRVLCSSGKRSAVAIYIKLPAANGIKN
jgi:hypothetical protein